MSSRRSRFQCWPAARSTRATTAARRRARWSAPTLLAQPFPEMPFDAVDRAADCGRWPHSLEIIGVVSDVTLDVYGALDARRVSRSSSVRGQPQLGALTGRGNAGSAGAILGEVRAAIACDGSGTGRGPSGGADDRGCRSGVDRERFALVLMAAFAGVSLLLATLGLYGVLAYAVGQRTQEIGIRMALGATAAQIRLTVLRQAAWYWRSACWPGRSVRWCSDVG